MEIYEIAYLFLGLATFVAAGTIINYSRKRSATAPDSETKKAFIPLYIFSIGLIMYGIGILLTYLVLIDYIILWPSTSLILDPHNWYPMDYTLFYIFTILELLFLSISTAMILRQRLLGGFMIIISIIAYLLLYNANDIIVNQSTRISNIADNYLLFGTILSVILLGANAALFMWIAYDSRRSTSLAIGYAMIVQVLSIPRLFDIRAEILPLEIIIAISLLSLMGPAMIVFAFLKPTQKISVELIGYGVSFAGPVLLVASLVITGLISDIQTVTITIFGALSVMFASGTASYAYGRWRETKQLPTALLLIIFFSFAIGHTVGMFGDMGLIIGITADYADFISSSFGLISFTIVALLAAGYRTAASLPLLLYVPTVILMAQSYPSPISEAFLSYWYLAMIVIPLFFLPIIIFTRAWRRMKQAGTAGSSRPLGMALGLLIYIGIRFPLLLLELPGIDPGYGFVVIAFIVFWLSITGRLEKKK